MASQDSADPGDLSLPSNQVISDQSDGVGAQSSQALISDGQQTASSAEEGLSVPDEPSQPQQETVAEDQITVGEDVTMPDPTAVTPLQSSKAVEVNVREFRQLLPRDAIPPVYTPQFLPHRAASLNPGELVIGVSNDGESKAYPIGPLASREMVNDVIAGVPILVTW